MEQHKQDKQQNLAVRRCAGGAIAVAVLAGLVSLPASPATAAPGSVTASQAAERVGAPQTARATIESDPRYVPGGAVGISGTAPANEWVEITGLPTGKNGAVGTTGVLVGPNGVWSTSGVRDAGTAPHYDVTVTPMQIEGNKLEPTGPSVSTTLTADPAFSIVERSLTVTDGLSARPGERAVLTGTANAFSLVRLVFEGGWAFATADHQGNWSVRSKHGLTRAEQVRISGNTDAEGNFGASLDVEVSVDGEGSGGGGENPPITEPVVVTSDLTYLDGTRLRISGTATPGARIEVAATDALVSGGLGGSVVASPTTGAFEYVSARNIAVRDITSVLDVTIRQGDEETEHAFRSLQEDVAFRPVEITSERTFVRGMPTRITGTASPYALLQMRIGEVGRADFVRTDADGQWELTTSKLFEQNETVRIAQLFGGNEVTDFSFTRADASTPITVSTTTFVKGQKQLIEGTAAPEARVEIYSGSTYLMHVTADAEGKWSYTTGGVINIDTFTRTLKSEGTDDVTFTLHAAPSQTTPITVRTTTFVHGQKQRIEGTAKPDTRVDVYSGSKYLMNVTADADGNWSYTTGAVITSETFTRTLKSAGTEDCTFTLTKKAQ